MLFNQWTIFGILSVITCDQGSHFVSSWWQTLGSGLGVRHARAQDYHHASNGRAEVAGQQLTEVLRKLHIEGLTNWVDALPQVIDRIHDMKGESGLSPYQILFGRGRPLGNVPYSPEMEWEDAGQFFKNRVDMDIRVATVMNALHEREAERINKDRRQCSVFKVCDKVW